MAGLWGSGLVGRDKRSVPSSRRENVGNGLWSCAGLRLWDSVLSNKKIVTRAFQNPAYDGNDVISWVAQISCRFYQSSLTMNLSTNSRPGKG